MRTAKAQISLRIRAVWSRPSVSANRIIGYYKMYELKEKARMNFAPAQEELNLRLLHLFEGTFSLDTAHIIKYLCCK